MYNIFHHILLVDDDLLLQKLLEDFLSLHACKIHLLPNGEGLHDFLHAQVPDLIILDIMMPGRNGFYWLSWLKENHPEIPVLILSSKGSADDRVHGLELGAEDYLPKPFHPKELLIRLRNILRNKPLHNSQLIRIGEHYFDPVQELFIRNNTPIKLTTLETRLLEFFCQNAGQILTRDAISLALHGNEHYPMARGIDMHVNRLRKKIEDDIAHPRCLHTICAKRLSPDPVITNPYLSAH